MKHTVVALAVLTLCASGAFAMDHGMKKNHKAMPATTTMEHGQAYMPNAAQPAHHTIPATTIQPAMAAPSSNICMHTFPSVFMSRMDFDDRVSLFLERSGFWDTCLKPMLNAGSNATIDFIFYTKAAMPADFELRRSVKAADDFMEELEDYIEDAQKYSKEYKKPARFLNISLPNTVMMTDELKRMLKDANKHFRHSAKRHTVTIAVQYQQAPKDALAGVIDIRTK